MPAPPRQNTTRSPNRITRSVFACVVVICPNRALPNSPFGFERTAADWWR